MKTFLPLAIACCLLASCGGGGGNPGTCEPASACQKSNEMPRADAPGAPSAKAQQPDGAH